MEVAGRVAVVAVDAVNVESGGPVEVEAGVDATPAVVIVGVAADPQPASSAARAIAMSRAVPRMRRDRIGEDARPYSDDRPARRPLTGTATLRR